MLSRAKKWLVICNEEDTYSRARVTSDKDWTNHKDQIV